MSFMSHCFQRPCHAMLLAGGKRFFLVDHGYDAQDLYPFVYHLRIEQINSHTPYVYINIR